MTGNVVLGTAKVGMPEYGFASGASISPADELLDNAHELGVTMLDTSPRYGDSENILGSYFKRHGYRFAVSTKVDNLIENDLQSENKIFSSVESSLEKMGVSKIDILYLHQNELGIISDRNILQALGNVRKAGLVDKVGTSIYSLEECRFSLSCDLFDVVQVPINLMDSYIYKNAIAGINVDKIITARSIFLQGILFNRKMIPDRIRQAREVLSYLAKLDTYAQANNITLIQMACAFVLKLPMVTNIIVGTSSVLNLRDIVNASKYNIPDNLFDELSKLSMSFKSWGNPRNW